MTPLEALRALREAITTDNGHGMPRFKDRAQAYMVLSDCDHIIKRNDTKYHSEFLPVPKCGEPGWIGHEWKPLGLNSDECRHCGRRAYVGDRPSPDQEHCVKRAQHENQ